MPGNQFTDHFDRRFDTGQRQRHQQSGQKLAGDVAANANDAARANRRRSDSERWKTCALKTADFGADLAQRIDEVADRPLVHARNARQPVVPARQRQSRGQ